MDRIIACACVALAAALAACSSSSSSEARIGSTTTALEFCTTTSELQLEQIARCLKVAPPMLASIRELSAPACAALDHEVAAGRATYDPTKGAACARAWATRDCSGQMAWPSGFDTAQPFDAPPECHAAIVGTIPPEGECWSSAGCAGGFCAARVDACGGVCIPFAGEGEDGVCAPGLGHTMDPERSSCERPSGEGGRCPCAAGLYCDVSGSEPVCRTQQTSGPCDWAECAPGYSCNGIPRACLPIVDVGAGCGATAVCGYGAYCHSSTGTCVAFPDVGQPCTVSRDGMIGDVPCARGWCDVETSTCRAPKADGEPCAWFSECRGYCDYTTFQCSGADVAPVCTPP
jgi:hypothetical protein